MRVSALLLVFAACLVAGIKDGENPPCKVADDCDVEFCLGVKDGKTAVSLDGVVIQCPSAEDVCNDGRCSSYIPDDEELLEERAEEVLNLMEEFDTMFTWVGVAFCGIGMIKAFALSFVDDGEGGGPGQYWFLFSSTVQAVAFALKEVDWAFAAGDDYEPGSPNHQRCP